MRFRRVALIVLDSVGIGELPDADQFGDKGSHTLGHIGDNVESFRLPHLQQWGLGNITALSRIPPTDSPAAYYGKMGQASVGKDTMTGHWELMGLRITIPFQTYPDGFPAELLQEFMSRTGRGVLGNKPASGTAIIDELGDQHMRTGDWIVYTSADSVFQIAAHEGIVPLKELYRACEIARELTLRPEYAVGRVIARPFIGQPGGFTRTPHRHDYAVKPPEPTVMNHLAEAGYASIAVGKISDIFAEEGVTASYPTKNNEEGINRTIEVLKEQFQGLVFTNLVDFDSLYGHRRDVVGYARALMEFDRRLPDIMEQIGEEDLLIITADHGNDPTHHGTDHTREYVPILLYSPGFKQTGSVGVRETFADVGAALSDNFTVAPPPYGTSFLSMLE